MGLWWSCPNVWRGIGDWERLSGEDNPRAARVPMALSTWPGRMKAHGIVRFSRVPTEKVPGLLRRISRTNGKYFPRRYDGLPIFTTLAVAYTGIEDKGEREEVKGHDTQRWKRDKRRLLLEER
jgi:hypothetical protein